MPLTEKKNVKGGTWSSISRKLVWAEARVSKNTSPDRRIDISNQLQERPKGGGKRERVAIARGNVQILAM